ncbi:hypothetical protein K432DRAFT_392540 [Lepidopterella palustris CBS 459.81]|uniref:Uncharacterized protein n=1 Tax=Lepidopterella palustris CBS 459.81 TaxID=1314670 RepID=A0A8E2EC55_9PEZI|nr:hypothetical protein K432DRAFT_392540 [Lepidopterella palustris CBS 459.81]
MENDDDVRREKDDVRREKDNDVKRETTENLAPSSSFDELSAPKKRGLGATFFPPGKTPGIRPRVRNHCLKFWWCHCLVVVVVVLVVVLPVIFVAIPHKAQHDVNSSTLEVQSQEVTDPTPSSVHLRLVSVVRSNSSYHPYLDAFRGALFLEDTEPSITPFGYVEIPKLNVQHEATSVVDQVMTINNMDQFIAYNKLVVNSDEFRIAVRGRTGLHQKGLPKINVDYNKVVTMKGLNRLNGFNITEFQILTTNEPDGSNMNGTVSIPNQSVLTIDLGNVTMDLSVQGTPIGQSLIPNLVLKPGDNLVPMRSTVNQSMVIEMITTVFKDGMLPVDILGNSSISNGQHLEYYEAAIQENTLHVSLNVGSALAALGINITAS